MGKGCKEVVLCNNRWFDRVWVCVYAGSYDVFTDVVFEKED
jgi:hypothetical protein